MDPKQTTTSKTTTTIITPGGDTPVLPPAPALSADHDAPVVLDLGRKSRKQIRRLRRGQGKLMNRIASVIDDLKDAGTISSGAQPVIVVVRERPEESLLSTFGM